MATEKLYSMSLVGLQREKTKVLDFLQEAGIVHVKPVEELSNKHELSRDQPPKTMETISHALLELRWMEEQLRSFAKKKRIRGFGHHTLKEEMAEYKQLKEHLHDKISKAVKTINEHQSEKKDAEERLSLLKSIPFPIGKQGYPLEGSLTFTWILELPEDEKSITQAKDVLKGNTERITLMQEGKFALLQGLNQDKETLERLLKHQGVRIVQVKGVVSTKESEISKLKETIKKAKKSISVNTTKLKDLAAKHYQHIVQLQHIMEIFHDRYELPTSFLRTEKTFFLEGFVPSKKLSILDKLSKKAKVQITTEEVNQGPTKLRNLPYVSHYEFVTKMFGLPQYGRLDPTFYLSLFIPLFFGFMFSDIGYGILLASMAGLLLWKSSKEVPILRDGGIVLLVCACSTMFFGWLFGSFFGNLIKVTPLLFDPFQEAKLVLIYGLALGLLHLNLGIFLSTYEHFKQKQYKEFLLVNVSIYMLEIGAVLLVFGLPYSGAFALFVALLLMIKKSGLMGIMDVTGFVGTWFSYARLLALSLATGGIALSINIMAGELNNLALLGPVLFFVLLIFGHLFNFVLNVLGSSINSVRLHYIEFFSQFYEGGGKPFKAFSTKRVKDAL